jgi:hypothetical protein
MAPSPPMHICMCVESERARAMPVIPGASLLHIARTATPSYAAVVRDVSLCEKRLCNEKLATRAACAPHRMGVHL